MGAHLATVAARNKSTKFVKIIGDQCIPNYPDRNMPTLLIYGDGDVKGQLVGAAQLGGLNMKPEGTFFFSFLIVSFSGLSDSWHYLGHSVPEAYYRLFSIHFPFT